MLSKSLEKGGEKSANEALESNNESSNKELEKLEIKKNNFEIKK